MNTSSQTVLISGAGSGMGLHTAQTLIRQGYSVYAGIRDPETRNKERTEGLRAYAAEHGKQVTVVDMDIHVEESCQRAVDKVIADQGRIDVVIHNAAHLFIGYSEGFTPEQFASSINTNLLGAHRLNRAALPYMRKQQHGVLLYVGSGITGIAAPFMAPYVTGKAALDALAECTAYEVGPFGIETVILMPGVFMDGTSHFASAVFPADKEVLKGYDHLQKYYDNYEPGLRQLFRSEEPAPVQGVADKIAEILAMPHGQRPFRPTIDYSDYGAEAVNAVKEAQTERVFNIMGFKDLLRVQVPAKVEKSLVSH